MPIYRVCVYATAFPTGKEWDAASMAPQDQIDYLRSLALHAFDKRPLDECPVEPPDRWSECYVEADTRKDAFDEADESFLRDDLRSLVRHQGELVFDAVDEKGWICNGTKHEKSRVVQIKTDGKMPLPGPRKLGKSTSGTTKSVVQPLIRSAEIGALTKNRTTISAIIGVIVSLEELTAA